MLNSLNLSLLSVGSGAPPTQPTSQLQKEHCFLVFTKDKLICSDLFQSIYSLLRHYFHDWN